MFDPTEGLLEIAEVNGAVETGSSVVASRHPVQPERRYGFIPREKFDNINTGKGLRIQRFFTQPSVDPFDTVEWERRTAVIAGERGEVVFEQKDVEVPAFWSQLATNVVASKYFRGQIGTPEREYSVRQVIGRVVETLTRWGREMGYFASEQDAEAFRDELKHLLLYQYAAFNSPVWFNVGIEPRPQCSACQPYHALVNTLYGPMPIGEIVEKNLVGLPVWDGRGLTPVVAVKHNGRKPVYRVQLSDGFFVEATADHLVCAHRTRRTKHAEWYRVDELKPGMWMRVYAHLPRTYMPDGDELEVSEAALAGWLQADGFVGQYRNGTNGSLTIEFMVVGQEEFEWVMTHLKRVFPHHHYHIREVETKQSKEPCLRIRLYGEALRPFVEKYELLRRGKDIGVPRPLWNAPNNVVAAYLRSLFQADGYACVHYPSAHIALAVISRRWVEELQVLLTRFGIYARTRQKREKRPDRYDLWELDISIASERQKFAEQIGFISEAKQSRLLASLGVKGKKCPAVRYQQIVSIEPLGEMEVYDIQTLSGCYLSNAVLVHNCFIVSVEDTMESILDLAKTEGMIFKFGSGSGSNLSRIRGSKEYLSGGGRASGPVSFMRGFDAFAGVIKSGGKTRRAAKMVVLNIDHPDIVDFIECKAKEEQKAWALIEQGYDPGFDTPGGAYDSVFFQNANHSVRVTDEFMRAVEQDGEWCTYARTTGEVMGRYRARELFRKIAEAAWICGDPGLQFHDTTNKWHTVKNSGPIEASNPCSEFVFLNDTSCNLASLNLMKFRLPDGRFDVEAFRAAVRILITAQEIIVDNSAYPTERICDNSHNFRPLGLGYANLGALLMSLGLPYDSDAGRAYAAVITAIMHGEAYRQSAIIARDCGAPFPGFTLNREPMMEVMRMHADALNQIQGEYVPDYLLQTAREIYQEMLQLGEQYGYRNAQVSVLAPTGTISFMMDCDTTGIEPDIALVKYKTLVGGGMLKIVNTTVPLALQQLGYSPEQIEAITRYIDEHDTIEGAPYLKEEHLPVFDCAFRPAKGTRSLAPMAHVKMMAAVQPFLSGAISKCVTGDTLLFTDRGILPIEQLYQGEKPDTFRPCSLKVASIDAPQEADLFYYGGFRPTIRLILQDGRIIEGTPNHRIKVANRHGYGWKRLDEVEPGDFVAIRLGAEMWSSQNARFDDFQPSPLYGGQKAIRIPPEMTPDLARLLGYYIAEGNMTRSNWTVRITNNDLGVLHRCQQLLRDLFDLESQIVTDARNGVTSVVATSKTLVEFLEYLGCSGKASEKQIPWAVLQSRREVVQAFVSALWLDGYIRRDGMVAICLASEKLLRQLQVVLNNFGIRANLIRKYAKTTDRFYTELTMFGESVVRFAALFDLDEAHKRERLAESVQYANRGAVHSDVVPCLREQIQDTIRAARHTYQWRQVFDPRTQHLSWNTVAHFYQHHPLSELKEIVNNNIHFVPVVEIESRFAPVYDLQVPGNHAFLGNCVINHNTVNMPHDATPEDIEQIYMQAWKMGLKAIAIYRDGSKRTQPLSTKKPSEQEAQLPVPTERPVRRHLPDERRSITHKFSIAGHEGYITVGMYEDGTPGEIFITMAKEGSVISGLMDAFATAISLALQYGVPLEKLVEKFSYTRFQPSGFTNNPQIPVATSIVDYIFRWLGMKFLNQQPPQKQALETLEEQPAPPVASTTAQPETVGITGAKEETPSGLTPTGQGETMDWSQLVKLQQDAPPCPVCGMIMVRAGACHQCLNCGTSYGCS